MIYKIEEILYKETSFFNNLKSGVFNGFRYEETNLIYDYWLSRDFEPGSTLMLVHDGIIYKGLVSPDGSAIAIEVI